MSGMQWGRQHVSIIMAGSSPALQGRPQGTINTAARSTTARLDVAPVHSSLTPCPTPEYGRGDPALPPLTTQASNLFQSVVAFVGDGCGIVDDQQYRRRLEICQTCDQRTGNRCAACGCWINVKARGRVFRCPIGHWQ